MKQVVILAGGKGTRLRERLGTLPKPLVDICGIPLLERQILLAKMHGFRNVLILINHGAEQIEEFCASRQSWGIKVNCLDDGHPRGTAGATLAAFDRLADEFLVMYGDTMLEVDLTRFHSHHDRDPGAAATLFVHPNDHPHDSDLVEMDGDGRILAFHAYPHDSGRYFANRVNAALYWIRKRGLEHWRDDPRTMDFAKDLFPAMLQGGLMLRGYCSPEYIRDIGTPARLDRVCADYRSGRIARASLGYPQSVVFMDRDGTLNREVDHLRTPDQLEILPGVEEAIRRLNQSDYRCCVVSNQPVVARGDCTEEDLSRIHDKLETLLGRHGAYIDRIYYCPHHPTGGFPGERPELKIDCNCRKPKTGMIEQAARDFNMSRERSWMIGDSSIDIETARRAGLKSILVETGFAGLDHRAWATPDATVPDLGAAVAFILDRYPKLFLVCSQLARDISEDALVLIGGHARSGKSTFAAIMRDALHACGRNALVLSLDRWLNSEQRRGPGVFGRYDMKTLQALVTALGDSDRRPDVLTLAGYHKLKREMVPAVETVSVPRSAVVLVEGTIVLSLNVPRTFTVHRFHIDIDEEERKQRILHEYRLRGYSEIQAREVYHTRLEDEYPVIEELARTAVRISLPPAVECAT